jgi:ribosomal protein S19
MLIIDSLAIPKVKPGQTPPAIRTQARSATILPSFVGLRFQVHNGMVYHEFTVTEEMVGHKLGEFSMWVFCRWSVDLN